ncbi:protein MICRORCHIDIA 7 isoform X1 [Lolium perenne]|uniref:protein MICRORCHIDIA 7 isoform X1 n=2 Tax=Lolium perenne TaxID=4522 RepID=UPI0021F55F16|nr:protein MICRORCHIDIA 7-like isoform X1 [Lolium perenne]
MPPTIAESEPAAHLSPPPPAVAGGANVAREAAIDVSSSDTESDSGGAKRPRRRRRVGREEKRARVLDAVPPGFLEPLPPRRCVTKQFWKAGDYDGDGHLLWSEHAKHSESGMEHVRVHPRFLHSNATSHKWALGAFAELLDNSLDEVSNGATFVNIDMLENKKDGSRMLLVQDDGGGMSPDKIRHCMSLGYSAKSKVKNTIGQYGNGFKTSTMRLGADVLVFSRSHNNEEKRLTQSIGMLSYTFLKSTGKDDIIVPMIDYEKGQAWKRKVRTTLGDWSTSLQTIIQWSPYSNEGELLQEFNSISEQGTRIIIYNLWEDEQGDLELDFDADVNDIQIRGVNRDEKNILMAKQFPNSKHFFTYRHSLRSYASILYLRVPYVFRMILRGIEIERHNIINDMMLKNQVTYKPVMSNGYPNDTEMVANVIIGFVKDAKHHVPIQGFNVYHRNRLIKPFWRVWTLPGSQGRGIIGVLEVNFVEPAHDKQDFERTNSLSRLEARLVLMQKKYWSENCHRIGYGGNHANRSSGKRDRECSPGDSPCTAPLSYQSLKKCGMSNCSQRSQAEDILYSGSSNKIISNALGNRDDDRKTGASPLAMSRKLSSRKKAQQAAEKSPKTVKFSGLVQHGLSYISDDSDTEIAGTASRSLSQILNEPERTYNGSIVHLPPSSGAIRTERIATRSLSKEGTVKNNGHGGTIDDPESVIKRLKDENSSLKERFSKVEELLSKELQTEREKNKSLLEKMENLEAKLETAKKEQEALVEAYAEEMKYRDQEEQNLRNKLKEASSTIQDLTEQLTAARSYRKS